MRTIIITRGLPGSGKAYWALEMLKKYPGKYKNICKDDLRKMFDGGKWSKGNEEFVVRARDTLIARALLDGKDVIVSDTNFEQKHIDRINELAKEYAYAENKQINVEVKFMDTPLEECVANDLKRMDSVGKDVIEGMWRKYLKAKTTRTFIPHNPALPDCMIVDIDGTLAVNMLGRSPYDWSRVGEDMLNKPVFDIVDSYRGMDDVILVSGRDEVCRETTEKWLQRYSVRYHHLYMRPEGNTEKDTIVKERIYREHIEGKYNVKAVFDDRDQVVRLWRGLGLTCLQVADGDF